MKRNLLIFAVLVFSAAPAMAQLIGNDSAPGDSCAGFAQGVTRLNADSDQDGQNVTLICDGTVWQAAGGGGGGGSENLTVAERSTDFSILNTETNHLFLVDDTALATLPTLSSVVEGSRIYIKRKGFGNVTVAAASGDTIEGDATRPISYRGGVMELVAAPTQWELLRATGPGGAISECVEGAVDYTTPGTSNLTVTQNMVDHCIFAISVRGGGGGASWNTSGSGGDGGGVQFNFTPTTTGTLYFFVGGSANMNNGGVGGGASGAFANSTTYSGGGGGASAVRFDTVPMAIAGGGGGGGHYAGSPGGDGGSGGIAGSDGAGVHNGSAGNNGTGGLGGYNTSGSSYGGDGGSNGSDGGPNGANCGTSPGAPGSTDFLVSGGGRGGGLCSSSGLGGGGGAGYGGGGGGGGYSGSAGLNGGGGGGGGGGFIFPDASITNVTAIAGAPGQATRGATPVDGSITVSWTAR